MVLYENEIKFLISQFSPLFSTWQVKQPWAVIVVGLIGPLKETAMGHRYILTGTCLFSKWVEAEAITDKSIQCVFQGLMKWIHRWGAPFKILCDQGKRFDHNVCVRHFTKLFNFMQFMSICNFMVSQCFVC